jgi:DNA polymerase III subunit gamma/tau
MSFYNTYRPKILADIDNGTVRKTVASLLTKKRDDVPHAYLLTGPRGTGKTTTARILAKMFNCITPNETGEPCGTCELCMSIASGNAMDILEIDAASNTGVDNIRDLKDKILLAPSRAKYKVYIIDEVHMLSTGAFNALLKTLEEPPPRTVFILATTDLHKVPPTIQSRCQMIQFQKPKREEIVTSLSRIVTAEKIKTTDELLERIADAADGSFRDATKLLEEATLKGENKLTTEIIEEILSTPKDSIIADFLSALRTKNAAKLIQYITNLNTDGQDIKTFYQTIISALQKLMVHAVVENKTQEWSGTELRTALNLFHKRYIESRNTNFPELPLQLAVLEYCEQSTAESPAPKPPPPPTPPTPPTPATQPTRYTTTSTSLPPQIQQTTVPKTPVIEPVILNSGELTVERITNHWRDVIEEMKVVNHSIAGVLRSVKPQSVTDGKLIIETQYLFHKDKLNQPIAKEGLAKTMKKLFGAEVTIEIVLIKK